MDMSVSSLICAYISICTIWRKGYLLAEVRKSKKEDKLQVHQHVISYLRQSHKSRFVVKVGLGCFVGLLFLGVLLGMGVTSAQAQSSVSCSGRTYTVVGGDTLSAIAQRFGTNWQALASSNRLANPNYLYIGQRICISGAGSTTSKAPVQVQPSGSVTSMIYQVFGVHGAAAVNVARCESGLNPNAINASSAASGLFQIIPSTWRSTSQGGKSPFNAYANIVAAHEIFARDGNSWREWVCQP